MSIYSSPYVFFIMYMFGRQTRVSTCIGVESEDKNQVPKDFGISFSCRRNRLIYSRWIFLIPTPPYPNPKLSPSLTNPAAAILWNQNTYLVPLLHPHKYTLVSYTFYLALLSLKCHQLYHQNYALIRLVT